MTNEHQADNEQAIQTDVAWVDVIHKMDEAYADLVRSQVELESKNVELEEAQRYFDSVQSSMNDVLIVCDNHGKIDGVNRALTEFTEQDSQELLGMPVEELISCPGIPLLPLLKQVDSKHIERDVEIILKGSFGDVPLSVNCSPRINHRGRKVGVVLVGRPVGELQRAYKELNEAHAELQLAQQRLVQSEKMASLGRLVAGVAHELNNPISFVFGNMHVLQRYTDKLRTYFDAVSDGATREDLREMRSTMRLDKALKDLDSLVEGTMEGAVRVKEIVDDLRQFSSTQASPKAPFDIIHVIRTAAHWIVKESKFAVDITYQLPPVLEAWGHAGQIHQVVVNLVQNAFDAMADSEIRSLILSAEPCHQGVLVTLKDSGPGISDADAPNLFEPFFTTKPVGKGTGLGLSISYGIVAEHHGELSITNHQQGGALARLWLPGPGENDA